MSSLSSVAPSLDEASHALRQVLLRLNHYAQGQAQRADPATKYGAATLGHLSDLQALLTAVEHYEQAVLASVAPVPAWQLNPHPTPAELRAEREACPVYRLGWVRGHRAGAAQAQRTTAPVLTAYAQHATLPAATTAPPATHTDLVQRVRSYLAELTARYGAGPISRYNSTAAHYGTN